MEGGGRFDGGVLTSFDGDGDGALSEAESDRAREAILEVADAADTAPAETTWDKFEVGRAHHRHPPPRLAAHPVPRRPAPAAPRRASCGSSSSR